MTLQFLSDKHAFHVRACEKTVVFMMYATGVFSVYTTPSKCRYYVPSHNLHFLRIADSDFDAFVCSDELVCRADLSSSR